MSVAELIVQLKDFSSPPTEAEKIGLNLAIDQHCSEQSQPELNLDNKDLKLGDYRNLFAVLKNNTTVKYLNFRRLEPANRVFSSQSAIAESLCDLLAHNVTLTSLSLVSSRITTYQAIDLLEALNKNPDTKLTVLDLSNNKIRFDIQLPSANMYDSQNFFFNSISKIKSKLVSSLIATKKLKKISLRHNGIPFRDREVLRLLLENLDKNSTLMQCDIDDNNVSKTKFAVAQYLSKIPTDQFSAMRPATFLGKELSATLAEFFPFLDPKDVGQVFASSPLPLEIAKIVNSYLGFSIEAFEAGFKSRPLEQARKRDEPKLLLEEPTSSESCIVATANITPIETPKVITPAESHPERKISSESPSEMPLVKIPTSILQISTPLPIVLTTQSNQKKWLQRGAVLLAVSAVAAFATLFVLGLPIVAGVLLAILGIASLVTYGISRKYSVSDSKTTTLSTEDILEKNPPPNTIDLVKKLSAEKLNSNEISYRVPQNLGTRYRFTRKPD